MTDTDQKSRAIVPTSFYPDFSDRQYPNVQIAGRQYSVVPASDVDAARRLENELRNLKANRLGWTIFAALAGALAVAGIVAVMAKFLAPQTVYIDRPFVVEKPVPVNNNCLLFCGR